MSTIKTRVDIDAVVSFLQNNFDKNIKSVSFIKGGEMSQAFYFDSKKDNLIIRVSKEKCSFEKDKYAYEHFANKHIPIPKILNIGRFSKNYYYALSKQVKGQSLGNFSKQIRLKLLPQLIFILDEIHSSKIDNQDKYGFWDSKGVASFDSWKKYILHEDEVYLNWDKLYKTTFIDKNLIEQVYKKIRTIIQYLPEDLYLIHGDYGYSNVISDGEKITGIIDWGESMYGDFVYDVSWQDFWSSEIKYGQIFKEHYLKKGVKILNYGKRLLCYKLHLGLSALGFYALSNQKKSYILVKNKLLSLLKSA